MNEHLFRDAPAIPESTYLTFLGIILTGYWIVAIRIILLSEASNPKLYKYGLLHGCEPPNIFNSIFVSYHHK